MGREVRSRGLYRGVPRRHSAASGVARAISDESAADGTTAPAAAQIGVEILTTRLHLRDDRLPRSALRRRSGANLLHRVFQRRLDDVQRRAQPRESNRGDSARRRASLGARKNNSCIRCRCSIIVGTKDPLNPLGGGKVKLPSGDDRESPTGRGFAQGVGADARLRTGSADGSQQGVLEITYDQCAKGGEVEYYRVAGLGHIWPGGNNRLPEKWVGKPSDALNATDVIWEFFKAHPRMPHPDRSRRIIDTVGCGPALMTD